MSFYLEKMFSLGGRVALVTGASRGIGASLAQALAKAGAYSIGIGRSSAPRDSFSEGVEYRQCDILDQGNFSSVCESIFGTKGRIDVLINAAGISLQTSEDADALKVFERTIATNLSAVNHTCQLAANFMKKTGGGSIINVTSIASVIGFPGNPAYVASKGGLRMLTKALAFDLAPHHIRVNNIVPGYIRTDMTEASFQDPMRHKERLQHMMIKRWGKTEDLNGAAIYLSSDASRYVTGSDLFIDGGWTAKGM